MKQPPLVSLPVRYQSLGKTRVAGTGMTVAIRRRLAVFVANAEPKTFPYRNVLQKQRTFEIVL
jgi:hypothetical protein